jgi:general secretion pathway protein B
MSYILEALKKAEQERHRGHVPDIGVQHYNPLSRKGSSTWLWVAGGLLAVNGVLGAFLIGRDEPDPAPSPVVMAPVQQTDGTSEAAVTEDQPPRSDAPRPSVQDKAEQVAVAPKSPPLVPIASRQPQATPPRGRVTVSPVPLDELSSEVSPAAAAAVVSSRKTAAEAGPPRWQDMPGTVRDLAAGLRLDVHVYDPSPKRRFVLINMTKYREGEQLADGPLLETITPTGVVLAYQGERFRMERE